MMTMKQQLFSNVDKKIKIKADNGQALNVIKLRSKSLYYFAILQFMEALLRFNSETSAVTHVTC